MEYEVHPELAGFQRALSPLELQQLEENCVADGKIIKPIVVWGQYIMDGRHRLPIARKHGLAYEFVELECESIEEAKACVIKHQLGQRNLSDQEAQRQRAEYAKLFGTKEAAVVANVSPRTVQRDQETTKAIECMPEDIREKVEKGNVIASSRDLRAFGKLDPDQKQAVSQKLRDEPSMTLKQALPSKHASLSEEELVLLSKCTELKPAQRRSIALGTIHCTSGGLRSFLGQKEEDRVTIAEMLNDPEIDSLDDAMLNFKRSKRPLPVDDYAKIDKIKAKVVKCLQDTMKHLDDIKALKSDKSGWKPTTEAIRSAMEHLESWR